MLPSMNTSSSYEAPVVTALGSVAEMTEAGGHVNADNPTGVNDAFSNYKA